MMKKAENKMVDKNMKKIKNKDYQFPAQNGRKAVNIKAKNSVDALEKYENESKKTESK